MVVKCEELMNTKFKKYDKLREEFNQFFGQGELLYQIDSKADIRMIDQINIQKASKEELASTEDLINNLNERLRHLSSVFETLT